MGPVFMRLLDRWVGIPACLICSLLDRFRSPQAVGTESSARGRRTLLIQFAEMGSVVLAEPAMRRAREHHGADLYFLIFASARDSLGLVGVTDDRQVFALRTDRLRTLFIDTLEFIRWSRRHDIEVVIDCEIFTRFSAVLAWLTPARRRAGFENREGGGLWRGRLFDRPLAYDARRHMALNFIALVEAAFGEPPAALPDSLPKVTARPVAARIRNRVQRSLELRCSGFHRGGRYVLINPHVGDLLPQRRWPSARFVELTRELLARHPDLHVFLTGSEAERAATEALAERIGDSRCASIAGCFPLAEIPALYAGASLLISSDSGPPHFAATGSMPVIVLFGPETPRLYRPLGNATVLYADLSCSPCVAATNQRNSNCRDNLCMQAISVDMVLDAAAQRLAWGSLPKRRTGNAE